jgi:gas vesicle protein
VRELQAAISAGIVQAEITNRSRRIRILNDRLDRMLALTEARSVMYGNQMGEDRRMVVNDLAEEKRAIADGFSATGAGEAGAGGQGPGAGEAAEYPKVLYHPGFPIGGSTGLLIKDYRGKNAEREIWKFDSGLESAIRDTMKQAAIEAQQWSDKKEDSITTINVNLIVERLNAGRQQVADAKKAADAQKAIETTRAE